MASEKCVLDGRQDQKHAPTISIFLPSTALPHDVMHYRYTMIIFYEIYDKLSLEVLGGDKTNPTTLL